VDAVEAPGLVEEVGGCFGGAADAGVLADLVGLDVHFEGGVDELGRDAVVAAPGAERGLGTDVVLFGEAELVGGSGRRGGGHLVS
jgi:hypothetical protein